MLKKKVLYALEQQRGAIVKGGQLADHLGVSRTAVWKAIRALREDGNEILSVPNVGYQLLQTNDTLSEEIISEQLSTEFIGRELTVLPTVHSTNQCLKERDAEGMASGAVIIADGQTRGRGRRRRAFLSEKGEGIYMSILLRLDGRTQDLRQLTICAAVAVAKAINSVCDVQCQIKWVNDIFLGGKKVCGILTEGILSGELQELDTVILGIGVNTGAVPEEIQSIATSTGLETGVYGIRNRLAAEILNQFEAVYLAERQNNGRREILNYYERRMLHLGQQVWVCGAQGDFMATVRGLSEAGALVIQRENGEMEQITSGEIKIAKERTSNESQ